MFNEAHTMESGNLNLLNMTWLDYGPDALTGNRDWFMR